MDCFAPLALNLGLPKLSILRCCEPAQARFVMTDGELPASMTYGINSLNLSLSP